jgi:hypothetical protein
MRARDVRIRWLSSFLGGSSGRNASSGSVKTCRLPLSGQGSLGVERALARKGQGDLPVNLDA